MNSATSLSATFRATVALVSCTEMCKTSATGSGVTLIVLTNSSDVVLSPRSPMTLLRSGGSVMNMAYVAKIVVDDTAAAFGSVEGRSCAGLTARSTLASYTGGSAKLTTPAATAARIGHATTIQSRWRTTRKYLSSSMPSNKPAQLAKIVILSERADRCLVSNRRPGGSC